MPEYPCKTKVHAQPLLLLPKLKTLSEVTCFDLYAKHDDTTRIALDDMCAMLRNHSTTTPSLDLNGLYPGGRPACINLWINQGFRDDKKNARTSDIARMTCSSR